MPTGLIAYEPGARPGEVHVARRPDGVTVIVPPAGYTQRLAPLLAKGAACLFVALLVMIPVLASRRLPYGQVGTPVLLAGFVVAGAYFLCTALHLARRRVRIDVDETYVRRTIAGPFGLWERAWERARVERVDCAPADQNVAASPYQPTAIYLRLVDGQACLLADSPDGRDLPDVAVALRDVLEPVAHQRYRPAGGA